MDAIIEQFQQRYTANNSDGLKVAYVASGGFPAYSLDLTVHGDGRGRVISEDWVKKRPTGEAEFTLPVADCREFFGAVSVALPKLLTHEENDYYMPDSVIVTVEISVDDESLRLEYPSAKSHDYSSADGPDEDLNAVVRHAEAIMRRALT